MERSDTSLKSTTTASMRLSASDATGVTIAQLVAREHELEECEPVLDLPKPETFAEWAKRVPDDFDFAIKASNYLTHYRRLREPAEPAPGEDGGRRGWNR